MHGHLHRHSFQCLLNLFVGNVGLRSNTRPQPHWEQFPGLLPKPCTCGLAQHVGADGTVSDPPHLDRVHWPRASAKHPLCCRCLRQVFGHRLEDGVWTRLLHIEKQSSFSRDILGSAHQNSPYNSSTNMISPPLWCCMHASSESSVDVFRDSALNASHFQKGPSPKCFFIV